MPRMPNFGGISGLASTSTLHTFSLPLYSGGNFIQHRRDHFAGPHHSAQKSTSTGMSELSTSASKVASLTCTIWSLMVFSVGSRTWCPRGFEGTITTEVSCTTA